MGFRVCRPCCPAQFGFRVASGAGIGWFQALGAGGGVGSGPSLGLQLVFLGFKLWRFVPDLGWDFNQVWILGSSCRLRFRASAPPGLIHVLDLGF